MHALRGRLTGSLGHPVIRPLIVLFVAVTIAVVAAHEAHESTLGSVVIACAALVLVIGGATRRRAQGPPRAWPRPVVRAAGAVPARAQPASLHAYPLRL